MLLLTCVVVLSRTWEKRDVYKIFWRGDLREGDHLEDTGVDARIILKWDLKKIGNWTRIGLIWFTIGTGGGLL
jgi:hypothetical protein